jgi:methionyl aminopeptidase
VICASVNQEICHGLPDERVLQEGDIVGIDIGLRYRGYCGDACVTYGVGKIAPETQRLLDVAKEGLRLGIEAARYGNYLNDIGLSIHNFADRQGVSVVREWGGHGVGKTLHEPPSVSIEPMINAGGHEWQLLEDGWTVVTKDGSLSAQFEHTVAITRNGPEILTLP